MPQPAPGEMPGSPRDANELREETAALRREAAEILARSRWWRDERRRELLLSRRWHRAPRRQSS